MIKKHTPTPWLFDNDDILSASDGLVATMTDDDNVPLNENYKDDAEFLVRAVNSHEALRTQAVRLEGMLAAIQHGRFKPTPENVKWYREEALKALQQAEGK